jgi:gliding motility-associated lipoprotein GldD
MMLVIRKISLLILPVCFIVTYGCREVTTPKPKGHFRIDLPEKEYHLFTGQMTSNFNLPLTFEYPSYGNLVTPVEQRSDPGWLNIEFPAYRAKIYLTYKKVEKDFGGLMEQTYKMNVKNHITKADAINEQVFADREKKVYGVLYDLKGNTASAVQFYVTDSLNHFLRGSLYFSAEPNADSLAPVIEFFRKDIIHLIETLKWKK